MKITKVFGWF